MFSKKITVADNQRVVVLNDQKFHKVLSAGTHKLWDPLGYLSFVTFDINNMFLESENQQRQFHKHSELAEHIQHWTIASDEVGLLYFNEKLWGIIAPSEQVYVWKEAGNSRLEHVNIAQNIELANSLLQQVNKSDMNSATHLVRSTGRAAVKPVAEVMVDKQHKGLLYIDNQFIKELEPGPYGFWQLNQRVEVKIYDLRNQLLEIGGQEILSKDRVSLRINLSANIRVTDAQLAANKVDKVDDFVYKSLQLALREAVGTKTLDELLVDKLYINDTVKELAQQSLAAVGVALESVGVKDIILPGEMKAILNQVVEAQKAAEANVIKRREETAATRSLHNTAKVMENNPTLLRLKELEALEKVAEKVGNLNVYGGLEGLMNSAVKLA